MDVPTHVRIIDGATRSAQSGQSMLPSSRQLTLGGHELGLGCQTCLPCSLTSDHGQAAYLSVTQFSPMENAPKGTPDLPGCHEQS